MCVGFLFSFKLTLVCLVYFNASHAGSLRACENVFHTLDKSFVHLLWTDTDRSSSGFLP